jgi:GTP-binding protein
MGWEQREPSQIKAAMPQPLVAIVGRPNVGKSTLFNRIIGSRRAIVGDEPGITRDRLYGTAEWRGRSFAVVDTGGIVPREGAEIPSAVFRQAKMAIDQAQVVVLVADARTPLSAPDMELAQLLLQTGRPLLLALNKVESERQENEVVNYYELGIGDIFPISAEHGRGVDVLLDHIVALLPAPADLTIQAGSQSELQQKRVPKANEAGPSTAAELRIAIVGRPNVGKSTLLNALTGEERSIVSEIPGTTRDAVDALIERGGRSYRVIDTAGIRRKGKTKLMAEKLSVVMARKHLADADLALVVIDAAEGPVALDATIAGYASEAGKSCIIVVNKWDVARARKLRSSDFEADLRHQLKFLAWAPMVFISAETGQGLPRLFDMIDRVAKERSRRITTGELNRFLSAVDFERATVPRNRRVKIYYISQVRTAPPTFVLFVDRPRQLHFSYQRFLENQIRRQFGFSGTPIVFKTRASK